MEFLLNFGLLEDDIKEIVDINYQFVIENLVLNKNKVGEIVNYLLSIGINIQAIKEIFMYQVGLFFKTLGEIKLSFEEYELDSIIKSLNYDVNNIELIDFI